MRRLYFLLIALLFTASSVQAQWQITSNINGVSCGIDATLTIVPYSSSHTYEWHFKFYSQFNQTGIEDDSILGTGDHIIYNPLAHRHGTTVIQCYIKLNGTINWIAESYFMYGFDTIPYYISPNCSDIKLPQAFNLCSIGSPIGNWYIDGVFDPSGKGICSPYSSPITGNYQFKLSTYCTTNGIVTPIIPIVSPFPVPTIVPGGPISFCPGDSINLSVGPAATYQWRKNKVNIPGATANNYFATSAGKYSVAVTYNSGCSPISKEIIIDPPKFITIAATDTAECIGNPITLTSPLAPGYTWSLNGSVIPGATSQTYTTTQQGTYTLTTTGLGCNISNPRFIGFSTSPVISLSAGGPLALHGGTGVMLLANTTNATYFQWYKNGSAIPGQTTNTFFVNQAGTYKCEASNGCKIKSGPKTVTVTSGNQLPQKTITIQPAYFSFNKDASISMSSPGSNYNNEDRLRVASTYYQSTGIYDVYRSLIQFDLSLIPPSTIINSAFIYLSQYNGTQSGEYAGNNSAFIDPLVTTWNAQNVTWNNQPQITTYNRSSTPVTYTASTINVKGAVVCMTNDPLKNYGWRIWLQDENIPYGKLNSYSSQYIWSDKPKITINYAYAKIIASGSLNLCTGGQVTLTTNSGPYTYQWKKNGINLTGETAVSLVATTAGNYSVVITDPTGSTAESVQQTVNTYSSPTATITASGPVTFCAGDSVILQANTGTGLSYQWKNNGIVIPGQVSSAYIAKTVGSYRVVVTNANGCSKGSPLKTVSVPCRMYNSFSETEEADIFPNPSSHNFCIKTFGFENTSVSCNVYDIRGSKIKSFTFISADGFTFGDDLMPGSYLIEITSGAFFKKQVLIKQ